MAKKKQNQWIWLVLIALVIGIFWFVNKAEPEATGIELVFYDALGGEHRASQIPLFVLVDGYDCDAPVTGGCKEMVIEVRAENTEPTVNINARNRFPISDPNAFDGMGINIGGTVGTTSTCTGAYIRTTDNYLYSEKTISPGTQGIWPTPKQTARIQLADCLPAGANINTLTITGRIQAKFVGGVYLCNSALECSDFDETEGFKMGQATLLIEQISGTPNFQVTIEKQLYS